jgi:beta-galactosidase/beta-glucuronidase
VKVIGSSGSFKLQYGRQDYFIKGAGGNHSIKDLKNLCGNSLRTWDTNNAQKILDDANSQGITVTLGIWLGLNPSFGEALTKNVKNIINSYKDHPALLIWVIGNEGELGKSEEYQQNYFIQINELAKVVKSLDSNHLVMTAVADLNDVSASLMKDYLTNVDIYGINSYRGCAWLKDKVISNYKFQKPYIVTEFGPHGKWDCGSAPCPEVSSTIKAEQYEECYTQGILYLKDKYCLGSYEFYWGISLKKLQHGLECF